MPLGIEFSHRTDWELQENRLTQLHHDLLEKKEEVFDLTISNPTLCQFDYSPKKILEGFQSSKNLVYEPSSCGNVSAREEVVRFYKKRGVCLSCDQIVLVSSTSEAYGFLFRLLTNPGDKVLFPRPSYPLFQFLSDLNDVSLEAYSLQYNQCWSVDVDNLRQTIDAKAKAVVCVNPNNPTGSFIKKQELQIFNELCVEHNCALISDEVFADFGFEEDTDRISLTGNKDVLTFILGGLSKTLGLPQMKLSWIVVSGPTDDVSRSLERLEIIADTYLSVNTPAQNALGQWLQLTGFVQNQIRNRIERNYQFLKEQMELVQRCSLFFAEGGWYAVLSVDTELSEEGFVIDLLKEKHVLVHPGYFFDFDQESVIVVSLLLKNKDFIEGINRIVTYLS
ncbi:Aminotransferase, class I and II [hydrothermal vent metagenome]|uniref:Aminotransferase, class I and II n=1 Tax=hydrothermal vent metagenome TaxID=652676 RepID=A0A3B0U1U4_9ZZZZ